MVCIAIVAGWPATPFRSLGRRYAVVGTSLLLVASAAGPALSWSSRSSSRTIDAALSLAGVPLLATVFGMRQVRTMTALRQIMTANPADESVANSLHRGRRLANAIRGLMALVTLAVVMLGAWIVTR